MSIVRGSFLDTLMEITQRLPIIVESWYVITALSVNQKKLRSWSYDAQQVDQRLHSHPEQRVIAFQQRMQVPRRYG